MTASEKLQSLVEKGFLESLSFVTPESAYFELIDILRQVETAYLMGGSPSNGFKEQKLFEKVRTGLMKTISIYLKCLTTNPQPSMFKSTMEGKAWALNLLKTIGSLELAERWVIAEKAGLVEINEYDKNKFKVKFVHEIIEQEHYDRNNISYSISLMQRRNRNAYQTHVSNFKKIQKEMLSTLQIVDETFIKYTTTPDIDRYFSKLGYFHLSNNSVYEDFGNDDQFGGVPYRSYLTILQEVNGVARKHFDYCQLAVRKNSKVDFFNILTYSFFEDRILSEFSNYLEISLSEIRQIFACLTLDIENIDYHEPFKGNILAPYVRTGYNQLTRTFYGAWEGGIDFLKRELKRRYEKDYFNAVNKREVRFREDIYIFFKGERFLKTSGEIIIKLPGLHTDIDAAIYDKKTGSLGLFQLKWQDMFFASLQERRSRITNLYPKAIDWIDKMEKWTTSTSKTDVMGKLKFDQGGVSEFRNVYLFVIARNQIHFTGIKPDTRAAWATTLQIIESYDRVKMPFNDPICDLYKRLQAGLPSHRVKTEGYPAIFPHSEYFEKFQLDF